MDYGAILRRAWEITWKHRALWLFGLLASLSSDTRWNWNVVRDNLTQRQQLWLAQFVLSPAFLGFILLMIAIGLGLEFLSGMGRAGLIHQVNRLEEDGSRPTVPSGWRASRKYMWPVFGIAVLLSLPALLFILTGLLPLILPWLRGVAGTAIRDVEWQRIGVQLLACFPPLCCAGVLVAVFMNMIQQLAERLCVLENRSVWGSITGAFALLRDRTGPVLVTWLILAGITIGLIIILGIPVCLLIGFASLPVRLLMSSTTTMQLVGAALLAVLMWLVTLAIGSVTNPFYSSFWTIAYRSWKEPALPAVEPIAELPVEGEEGNEE